MGPSAYIIGSFAHIMKSLAKNMLAQNTALKGEVFNADEKIINAFTLTLQSSTHAQNMINEVQHILQKAGNNIKQSLEILDTCTTRENQSSFNSVHTQTELYQNTQKELQETIQKRLQITNGQYTNELKTLTTKDLETIDLETRRKISDQIEKNALTFIEPASTHRENTERNKTQCIKTAQAVANKKVTPLLKNIYNQDENTRQSFGG